MADQPQPSVSDDTPDSGAFAAVLSMSDAAIEGLQYEVEAAFDNERNLIGYRVRVKDLDGFGKGYV